MDAKARLQQYCIAIFSTIAAMWLRQGITPWVGERVPFGTYLIAVLLTSWLGGTGPATMSLLLGIVLAAHVHVLPENTLMVTDPADLLALFIYGVVGGVAILVFDRSSRQHEVTRQQLAKIETLSAELQRSDRRKDEFLAMLAHELRNPLAPIRSGLMLLQRSDVEDQRRTTVLKTVCRQLGQLIRIVDDLLDVSRFVNDKIKLDCADVDLQEIIETAVEQAQTALDERQHKLHILLPKHPVIVDGDRVRLVQIIANLLTNAARYTPNGGRIQLLVDVDAKEVSLHVIDNGIGIALDFQSQIFDLFTRADATVLRDQGGLGLGLTLARQFAEMHGGRLRVASEGLGRGSCFTLTLPVTSDAEFVPGASHAPVDSEPDDLPQSPPVAMDGPPAKRVLIIDDNCDAAETLAALLSLEGFDVHTARDGTEGIQETEVFHPDVVLLDIGLPGMDGYEVARRLRSDPCFGERRIFAVTGWGGTEDVKRSQAAGIHQHLVKPVDPVEVTHLIRDPSVSAVTVTEQYRSR